MISFLRDSAALEQSLKVNDKYSTLHNAANPMKNTYRNAQWIPMVNVSTGIGLRMIASLVLRRMVIQFALGDVSNNVRNRLDQRDALELV